MSRRAYRPPKRRLTTLFAIVAGLVFTALLFLSIPLSQKIAQALDPDSAPPSLPPPPEPPPPAQFEQEQPPDEPPPEEFEEPEVVEAPDLAPMEGIELSAGPGTLQINMGSLLDDMKPGDVLGDGSLDRRAEPTTKTPPVIPRALKSKFVNGTVTLIIEIDKEGRVTDVRVKSSTEPRLNPYAIAAVRRWKFKPAIKGGKKAKDTVSIPIKLGTRRK